MTLASLLLGVTDPTPFIVGGIVSGSVYGMAAMGLVFTYKVSRVVNFAYGTIAMFCAYIYWQVNVDWGVTSWIAMPIAVLVTPTLLALVTERVVYRKLASASVFAKTAASIGVLLALYGISLYYWQASVLNGRLRAPTVFSRAQAARINGVNISWQQIGIVSSVLAIVLILFVLLRFTRTGISLRATVVNRDLAELRGIDTLASTRIAWIVSYILAACAGVLFASLVGGDPLTLTLIVIFSLSAAAIGGLTSLPLAFGGGVFIGVAAGLALAYQPTGVFWSQLRLSMPFFVLLGALVIRWRAFSVRDFAENRTAVLHDLAGAAYARKPQVKLMLLRVVPVVLIPALVLRSIDYGYGLTLLSSGVAFGIIFLSYRMFTATTGMVSLAQASFAGIGAFTTAGLITKGMPWIPAALGGAVVAGLAGVLLALPTVRLRGIFLTLASVAFAMLVENVVFTRTWLTGGLSGKPLPRPLGFDDDFNYFLLLLAIFLVIGYFCERFQYSPIGRELQAELGSSAGAQSIGIRPEKGRVIAFGLSAALAGLGGTFLAAQVEFISPDTWGLIPAFVWLVLVASGGLGSTAMMVQIGVAISVLPVVIESNIEALSGQSYVAVFGVLGLLVLRVPGGAVGIEERVAARVQRWWHSRSSPGQNPLLGPGEDPIQDVEDAALKKETDGIANA